MAGVGESIAEELGGDQSSGPLWKPLTVFVIGLVLLVRGFTHMDRVPGWADQHGVWVWAGLFFYMAIAGRLLFVGADQLGSRLLRR